MGMETGQYVAILGDLSKILTSFRLFWRSWGVREARPLQEEVNRPSQPESSLPNSVVACLDPVEMR